MRLRRKSRKLVCDFNVKTPSNYRLWPHLSDVNKVLLRGSKEIIIKNESIKILISDKLITKEYPKNRKKDSFIFTVPCLKKSKSFSRQDLYLIISLLYETILTIDRKSGDCVYRWTTFKNLQLASLNFDEIKNVYTPQLY
jgi:hypothetical protein